MRCCLLLAGLSRLSRAYAQDDCHAGELQLLQRKLDLETSVASSTEPLVLPQLRAAEPVKWLHIPKCGTSFLNALIHLPSVCPGVNASYRVDDKVLGKHFEEEFFRECPEVCNTSKFNCDYGHHEGIGTSYEMELKGVKSGGSLKPALTSTDIASLPEAGYILHLPVSKSLHRPGLFTWNIPETS